MNQTTIGTERQKVQLCVIGGGMSGICAAVSAARRGLKVALVQDRPVLGGNASSEVRMWIRGAASRFPAYREGGIIEELAMDNIYFNPTMTYAGWDGVLYNKVISEPNITLYLNSTCISAQQDRDRITEITVWRMTSYTFVKIEADYFADCSGDCILAEFTDAKFRTGREGKNEFQEKGAPIVPDKKTMGNSCILQAREQNKPVPFIAPPFAYKFSDDEFIHRLDIHSPINLRAENFWWLEIGGDGDSLKNADEYNQKLISMAYGAWDYIKNSGKFNNVANWELDWVGFLAGKRESRRYVGDYILTENDMENSEIFHDEIAYGGWGMDDHNPAGIATREPPNIDYLLSKPYGIPYRCIYSSNIVNLFFAGRNISVTHRALSSTRVMATCGLLGQAVGEAAAIAAKYSVTPRDVAEHIEELQQNLRDDDCYLLDTKRKISETVLNGDSNLSERQKKLLFNGTEREIDEKTRSAELELNKEYYLRFQKTFCGEIRLLFDNDIARNSYPEKMCFEKLYPLMLNVSREANEVFIPPVLVREYVVEARLNGAIVAVFTETENRSRLVKLPVNDYIDEITVTFKQTYGGDKAKIFSIDLLKA